EYDLIVEKVGNPKLRMTWDSAGLGEDSRNDQADRAMLVAAHALAIEDRTCLPDRQEPVTKDQSHRSSVIGLRSETDHAMLTLDEISADTRTAVWIAGADKQLVIKNFGKEEESLVIEVTDVCRCTGRARVRYNNEMIYPSWKRVKPYQEFYFDDKSFVILFHRYIHGLNLVITFKAISQNIREAEIHLIYPEEVFVMLPEDMDPVFSDGQPIPWVVWKYTVHQLDRIGLKASWRPGAPEVHKINGRFSAEERDAILSDRAMLSASHVLGTEDRTCLPDRQGPRTNDQSHQSLVFGLWSEDDSAMLGYEAKEPFDDDNPEDEGPSDRNGREQEANQPARSDEEGERGENEGDVDGGDFAFIDKLRAKDFDELFNPDDDGEALLWMPQEPSADAFILPTARTLFEKAEAAEEEGLLDQALAYLEGAIEEFPEFAAAYGLQGDIYSEQNKYEEAIEAYTKALAIKPENAAYHSGLGIAYRRIKKSDWNSAIRHLELAKQYDPGNVDHYINLSEAYRIQGSRESRKKGLALCQLARKLFPDDAGVYVVEGNIYYDLGKYDIAEDLFRQAIAVDPENDIVHMNLITVLIAKEKFVEVLVECRRARALNREDLLLKMQHGFCLIELGHSEEAAGILEQIVKEYPNDHEAFFYLGYAYICCDDQLPQAEAAFRRAVELCPDNTDYLYNLSFVLGEQEKYQEAFELVMKVETMEWNSSDKEREEELDQAKMFYVCMLRGDRWRKWEYRWPQAEAASEQDGMDMDNHLDFAMLTQARVNMFDALPGRVMVFRNAIAGLPQGMLTLRVAEALDLGKDERAEAADSLRGWHSRHFDFYAKSKMFWESLIQGERVGNRQLLLVLSDGKQNGMGRLMVEAVISTVENSSQTTQIDFWEQYYGNTWRPVGLWEKPLVSLEDRYRMMLHGAYEGRFFGAGRQLLFHLMHRSSSPFIWMHLGGDALIALYREGLENHKAYGPDERRMFTQRRSSHNYDMLTMLPAADDPYLARLLEHDGDQVMVSASHVLGTEDRGPRTNDQSHQSSVIGLWPERDPAMLAGKDDRRNEKHRRGKLTANQRAAASRQRQTKSVQKE
ncbi:MAG TPA: tetratricopeptide repeat protein, partial [Candidatus Bathyarchaeia archaeon]|nr:tetratricopeptide repeat protein [Candidatus Bathyarchaeia archaeon]